MPASLAPSESVMRPLRALSREGLSMHIGSAPGSEPTSPQLYHRMRYLVLVVFVAFGIIVARLYQLQVVRGEEYHRQTRRNVVDTRLLPSVRGKILDRHRVPIADNRPAFNLYGVPDTITSGVFEKIVVVLDLSQDEAEKMKRRLAKARKRSPHDAALLLEDQPRDRAALVKQEHDTLKELSVRDEPSRYYPRGRALAHLVGYMNQITGAELTKRATEGYLATELVGRSGLERAWESYLRGKKGIERFVVNAKRERVVEADTDGLIEGPEYVPPVPGHNLVLTIDLELQETVERGLQRHAAGGVAVVEVETGRILALASTPSFDPNVMTGHLTRERDTQMRSDPRKPFIDKTLRQHYPPGSTYKFVVALAALRDGLITADEPLSCPGVHRVGRRTFRCTGSHEKVGLLAALQHSCNVYFWKLSERVGMDSMAVVAKEFGFGEPTGLGLNNDVPGRVPTRQWYEERDIFKIGHTLNAATGQGDVEVTVLQLAMAYAALANGGRLFVPQVVDRVETAGGDSVVQYEPQLRRTINFRSEWLNLIGRGMWMVVNTKGGTAYKYAHTDLLEYSGKTGTAQVKAMRRRDDDEGLKGWHPDRDHAWFAGFAPSVEPEIAFVVFLEHGGSGGKNAGPVAKTIVEKYFEGRAVASEPSEGEAP